MFGKTLVVILAVAAGASGAAAYEYASVKVVAQAKQVKNGQMLSIEERLDAVEHKLRELNSARNTSAPQVEILVARLSAVEKRLAKVQEVQSRRTAESTEESVDSANLPSSEHNPESSAEARAFRISGEELVAALKDLPEEGIQMIRSAIRKEVDRAKRQEDKKDQRADLERKAEEGIRKAAIALSLTPVQVEQAKEIAARFIDKIMEIDKIARERSDPAFAESAKKELGIELRAQVVEILTPEQLDKARELDPEGIGREYPRGF